MTTGVIYARVSSIGDRQSTERQVKDLSEYAKYKGIEVCKVFEEHLSGAKKNDERPVLCEAMEYCKANRIGSLLVSELSRLGRNAFEVLASVKELIDSGINLYIQKEQLTTKSAITAIILLILRSFQRKGLCNSGLKAKSITLECC